MLYEYAYIRLISIFKKVNNQINGGYKNESSYCKGYSMYVCMYECMYLCTYIWMYICMHAYMNVCSMKVCICMYVCMYVCTQWKQQIIINMFH